MCVYVCVRRNILPEHTKSYLRSCNYRNDEENRLCPTFRVGDIVTEAHKSGGQPDIYDSIALQDESVRGVAALHEDSGSHRRKHCDGKSVSAYPHMCQGASPDRSKMWGGQQADPLKGGASSGIQRPLVSVSSSLKQKAF